MSFGVYIRADSKYSGRHSRDAVVKCLSSIQGITEEDGNFLFRSNSAYMEIAPDVVDSDGNSISNWDEVSEAFNCISCRVPAAYRKGVNHCLPVIERIAEELGWEVYNPEEFPSSSAADIRKAGKVIAGMVVFLVATLLFGEGMMVTFLQESMTKTAPYSQWILVGIIMMVVAVVLMFIAFRYMIRVSIGGDNDI